MWVDSRCIALASAFALLAVGCVHNKVPGAGIQAITTDLQYKQLQQKNAAPPNSVPPAPPTLPSQPTIPPFASNGFGPPLGATNVACPTAAPTTQAQQDVSDTITKLPEAGRFIWRLSGRQLYQGHALDLPRYEHKTVQNVKGSASKDAQSFTYDTEEKEINALGGGQTVRSSWSVTSQTATDRTVTESQSGQTVSSGRVSTAGLSLTRIVRQTNTGVSVFVPSQPIRYLITPVIIGPDRYWQDSAADSTSDPSNPQTLTFKAFVKDRVTIDACGERLRGWLVSSDSTYSSGGSSVTRHYEYGVATQMGGIIVYEYGQSPCTSQGNGKCQEGKPTLEFKANYGKKEA